MLESGALVACVVLAFAFAMAGMRKWEGGRDDGEAAACGIAVAMFLTVMLLLS